MGEFSIIHWIIIVGVLLLLFGPSKLPQLGSSLGLGIKNFKKSIKDIGGDSKDDKDNPPDDQKKLPPNS